MMSFIVGCLCGAMVALLVIITVLVLTFKFDGTVLLKYDSEGEGPYLFLEAEEDPRKMEKKAYVIFKVKSK